MLLLSEPHARLARTPYHALAPAAHLLTEASCPLQNKLVELLVFLENLAVKDSSEKDLFFKRLPQSLPGLPLPVAQYKLLPLLSQALEFGGAPAVALGSILQVQRAALKTAAILVWSPLRRSCHPQGTVSLPLHSNTWRQTDCLGSEFPHCSRLIMDRHPLAAR